MTPTHEKSKKRENSMKNGNNPKETLIRPPNGTQEENEPWPGTPVNKN
jgi:hypothetical protein